MTNYLTTLIVNTQLAVHSVTEKFLLSRK